MVDNLVAPNTSLEMQQRQTYTAERLCDETRSKFHLISILGRDRDLSVKHER